MKRPGNAAIFVAAATAVNFILIGLAFFGFLTLYGLFLAPVLKLGSSAPVILAAFGLAVALDALAYRAVYPALARRFGLATFANAHGDTRAAPDAKAAEDTRESDGPRA